MHFVSVRVITDDVQRLVGFYADVLGMTPTWYTEDFAELATPGCTLAVGSTRTMALFGAGAARPAANHTAILEFHVEDVDAAYARVRGPEGVVRDVVQAPTTQPWGNRSLLFRDPDGNLVNFFTPVSPAARQKYRAQAGAGAA